MRTTLALFFLSTLASAHGYTFTKCGLASTLLNLGVSRGELHKWVCMARYESNFRTTATNTNSNGSRDFGVFQINSYWNCDPQDGSTTKNGCGKPCSAFTNTDLSDDVACIRRLLRWQGSFSSVSYAYRDYCQGKTSSYLSECTL